MGANVYTSGDFLNLSGTHCCGAIIVEGITDGMEFSCYAEDCAAGWLEDDPENIVLDLVRASMNRGNVSMYKNLLTMYDVCPVGRTYMCGGCEDEVREYGYVEGVCDDCEYSSPEDGDYVGVGVTLQNFVRESGEIGSITLSPWVRNCNSGNYIRSITWILPEADILHKWAMKHHPDVVERIKESSGLNWSWLGAA